MKDLFILLLSKLFTSIIHYVAPMKIYLFCRSYENLFVLLLPWINVHFVAPMNKCSFCYYQNSLQFHYWFALSGEYVAPIIHLYAGNAYMVCAFWWFLVLNRYCSFVCCFNHYDLCWYVWSNLVVLCINQRLYFFTIFVSTFASPPIFSCWLSQSIEKEVFGDLLLMFCCLIFTTWCSLFNTRTAIHFDWSMI